MLIGSYRHSIDSKNRMRMPSKFKSELGSNFVITKGTGKNLFVFSAKWLRRLWWQLKISLRERKKDTDWGACDRAGSPQTACL